MSYVMDGATIVDIEAGCAIPGQTVLIQGDCITRIGAQGAVEIPQGAQVIPGQGLYLMPGLADSHVHYFDAPIFGRLMVANGVLLVRDMGMPTEHIQDRSSGHHLANTSCWSTPAQSKMEILGNDASHFQWVP